MTSKGNDITEEFFEACNELQLGELVIHKDFSPADAMSAIEIMDPKMDLGMTPIDDDLSLLKQGKINVGEILGPDIIAGIDATISLIVSWLHGNSLDETVFTNVCLLDVKQIKNKIFHGFCLGALNFVQGLRLCINWANVFDEEDYSPNTYWQNLQTEFVESVTELDDALKTVCLLKKRNIKKDLLYNEAIKARLQFLQQTFLLFSNLFSNKQDFVPNFHATPLIVDQVLSSLNNTINSVHLGTQPVDNKNDSDFSWLKFIKPRINRPFLPPTFPKTLKIFSRNEAYKYLQKMFMSTKEMIIELPEQMHNLDGLLNFLKKYSDIDSCLLTRSISQLLVIPNDNKICGLHPLINIIAQSVDDLDKITHNSLKLNFFLNTNKIHDDLNNFLLDSVKVFSKVFQIFGHNSARQCDKLLRFCFAELVELYYKGHEIDAQEKIVHRLPYYLLSSFVFYHILELMYYYFQLSFKLDIFVPYEYCYVYWYFGEKVLKNFFIYYQDRVNALYQYQFNKNFLKIYGEDVSKDTYDIQDLHNLNKKMVAKYSEYKSKFYITSASVKFLTSLHLIDLIKIPEEENLRYYQRFEMFSCLTKLNLYCSYEVYKNYTNPILSITLNKNFLIESTDLFENAISILKSIDIKGQKNLAMDIESLIKIVKRNVIVSKLIVSSPDLDKKLILEKNDWSHIVPLVKLC